MRYSYNKNKKKLNYMILIIMIFVISIGYAILSTNLNIIGTGTINNPTWNIHWENVQVKTGSVSATTPTIDTAKTTVNYSVTLTIPGDYYEFTVDAVNSGTIDGMVSVISNKLNNVEITTLPSYLEYKVSYEDGVDIAPNHLLASGTSEKYKVHVGYKKDISSTDIPATPQTFNLSFSVTYVQSNADSVTRSSFKNDSWQTIINNVRNNTIPNYYKIGMTKNVDMGEFGTHTLRIANTSTPVECSTEGFSQTACGFVLEFSDIITEYNMNPAGEYKGVNHEHGHNIDGWPASAMRSYISTEILNMIPSELRNGIIDTTVVSGHGNTAGETNFTSTDKLYLLSTHELWEDDDGNPNGGVNAYDSAYDNTRQLDYYASIGVTTSNPSGAIKYLKQSRPWWWLRSPRSNGAGNFSSVLADGGANPHAGAFSVLGVSPAFRIG